MTERSSLPFRIGATSYIIPDDLAPNAHFLAGVVGDMQLVLFDVEGGPNNIPSPATVAELAAIGQQSGLSYTVHLIHDLWLGADSDSAHPSLVSARQLIELTRPLQPWAYVLHLNGRSVRTSATSPAQLERWQADCVTALSLVVNEAGGSNRLAVENLETYAPEFVTPVVEAAATSRCLDVGHLWLDNHDPLPFLQSSLPRLAVVHLHGLHQGRDHQSLAHTPIDQLDPVTEFLLRQRFNGVVTLEVFGQDDFESSLAALRGSINRVLHKSGNGR